MKEITKINKLSKKVVYKTIGDNYDTTEGNFSNIPRINNENDY
jgi:hypothetical protein